MNVLYITGQSLSLSLLQFSSRTYRYVHVSVCLDVCVGFVLIFWSTNADDDDEDDNPFSFCPSRPSRLCHRVCVSAANTEAITGKRTSGAAEHHITATNLSQPPVQSQSFTVSLCLSLSLSPPLSLETGQKSLLVPPRDPLRLLAKA